MASGTQAFNQASGLQLKDPYKTKGSSNPSLARASGSFGPVNIPKLSGLGGAFADIMNGAAKVSGKGSGKGGGGGGASGPTVDAGAVSNTQKAIDSLGLEESTGRGNIDRGLASLLSKYDKEAARTKSDYDGETVSNTTSLGKNKQNALLAAAQGRRGLRGTLSAIGALSGDGAKLADQAVRTSANEDIGGATDTYATNAQNLDKAFDRFSEEDKDRRAEAQTTRQNQTTALEGSIASKRQNFLQKMAELYSSGGNKGKATEYLNQAGDLNNTIASKSAVQSTAYSPKAAAFTPGKLESYLAGAGDKTVQVAEGDGTGGTGGTKASTLLFGKGNKKKEEEYAA